jgi:acetyl-CoA acetyltransferase
MARIDRQPAIVGVGCSELSKSSETGLGTLVARASRAAIVDAGLDKGAIDGVVGVYSTDSPTVWPGYVVEALGLPNVVWWDSSSPPSVVALSAAAQAVVAGNCAYALCYHGKYRWASTSIASRGDPYRRGPTLEMDPSLASPLAEHSGSLNWASRVMRQHMDSYGSTREDFGRIAINNRTNAGANPRAVFRGPITMDDYLAAPMIDDPMCLLDMDAPIDGAMAVVVAPLDRARGGPHPPVVIDAFSSGLPARNDGLLWPEADSEAFRRAVLQLFARTERRPHDVDLAYPYDGFTILTMLWLEALFTEPGEGPALLREAWSEAEQRLRLFGRIPVCTHGGNLSEGRATQGFGHVLEAVQQLRGEAGARQVPKATTAVVTNGMASTNRSVLLSADVSSPSVNTIA